jgi:integrase
MNTRPNLRLIQGTTDPRNNPVNLSMNIRSNDKRDTWGMFDDLNQFFELKARTTARQYRKILEEFCGLFGIEFNAAGAARLKTVGHVEVTRYSNYLRTLPAQAGRSASISDRVSLATVKHKIIVLSSIWDELVNLAAVTSNPWRKPKRDMQRIRGNDRRPHQLVPFQNVAELFKLNFFEAEGAQDKALLAALFGGALRLNEAINLRVGDVKEGPEGSIVLTLRNTKRQRAEEQSIGAWAAEHVRAYLQIRRGHHTADLDPLFTKYRAGKPINEFLYDRTVRRSFGLYMRRVGLTGSFSPHCARATAITKLLEDGVPHREVAKFSRHGSVAMIEHYDKLRRAKSDNVAHLLKF